MHFYGWKKGLKTGSYYIRTKAASKAIQFTVDQQMLAKDSVTSGAMPQVAAMKGGVAGAAVPSTPSKGNPLAGISNRMGAMNIMESAPPSPTLSHIGSPRMSDEAPAKLMPLGKSGLSSEVTPTVADKENHTQTEFEAAKARAERKLEEEQLLCSLANPESCMMCSG